MSQVLKAADDIKSFASRIRGFLEVAETLERIGNLEQAQSEAQSKTNAVLKNVESIEALITEKKELISKLDSQLEEAKKMADGIISEAKKRAVEIFNEAGIKSNDVVRAASDKKSSIEQDIVSASEKLADIVLKIAEHETILGTVFGKIEEAKEKVSSLFK